jgi:hypothetical protein
MASATFQLKAVDETAQAFASVQNNLQRLKNTSNEAGRALTKNLDVKDAMRSMAMALGLSADKIANKIAEWVTGQTEEVIRLQDELAKAGEEATKSAAELAKAKGTDIQNTQRLINEEARLSKLIQKKPTDLAGQVAAQKAINDLNLVQIQLVGIYGKQWDDVVAEQQNYNKLRKDMAEADKAFDAVSGKRIETEGEYNDLIARRLEIKNELKNLDTWTIEGMRVQNELAKEYADVTRQLMPLEQERRKLAMDAGQVIASGFEDAVLSGNNLRETLRGIAQDLLRLVFRQQVTAPLAGFIGEALFKGFRAEGGPVGAGNSYVVGEKGPELFVPGSSGSIVPNGAMGGGGGGGGTVVNLSYNIASGVTRAELKPILEQQRAQLRREIPDAVRRGGSYRTAFA